MPTKEEDFFDEKNQVKNTYIKWGKFGDKLKGTLTSKRQVPNNLSSVPGALQWVYEILVDAGSYHDVNADTKAVSTTPTVLEKGTFVKVTGRPSIDDAMRTIKIGQIVGFVYKEDRPNKKKGYNASKIVIVYRGEMDQNYHGQEFTDIEEAFPGSTEEV